MILVSHIIIAILSLAHLTYTVFRPTHKHLNFSYVLVASTITSGTYLALLMPDKLAHVCLMGLLYAGAAIYALSGIRQKLAASHALNQDF